MQDIVTLLVGGTISHGMFSTVGECAATRGGVLAKKLMFEAAQERILVGDHLRFKKIGLSFVCGIGALDMIITDSGVDADAALDFPDCGVQVMMRLSCVAGSNDQA